MHLLRFLDCGDRSNGHDEEQSKNSRNPADNVLLPRGGTYVLPVRLLSPNRFSPPFNRKDLPHVAVTGITDTVEVLLAGSRVPTTIPT